MRWISRWKPTAVMLDLWLEVIDLNHASTEALNEKYLLGL
jgi:hypothetical protein